MTTRSSKLECSWKSSNPLRCEFSVETNIDSILKLSQVKKTKISEPYVDSPNLPLYSSLTHPCVNIHLSSMAAHSHSARPFEVFCTHITPHEKPLVGGTNDQQQNIFHNFFRTLNKDLGTWGSRCWQYMGLTHGNCFMSLFFRIVSIILHFVVGIFTEDGAT